MANKDLLKTGVRNIPNDGNWNKLDYYFHYSLTDKERSKLIKGWVKKNYSKEDAEKILACPEQPFANSPLIAAATYFIGQGYEFPEKARIYQWFEDLLEQGTEILDQRQQEKDPNKRVYSPRERLMHKINATIIADIDILEEQWSKGETPDFNVIDKIKIHDLKPMAVPFIIEYVEGLTQEYKDAHSGQCKQAKEAYSHLGKRDLTKRIKCLNKIVTDLNKFKDNQKRKTK